jgi:HemY protein
MRTWFWTLLLAVVAVALAVTLQSHAGNVLLLVYPWRIELSLTLAVLLIIASFVLVYVGLRFFAWLIAIPSRVRSWRGQRAQARDHELLERGWTELLEGRFAHAEKDLAKLYDQTKVKSRRVLAALSAARAAHGLGEGVRRDLMLDRARESAGGDAGLNEAVATVTADLLLEEGKAREALAVLEPLQDGGARHLNTLRLVLRAERELGNHERVFALARSLSRRNAMSKVDAERLIGTASAARLQAATGENWRLLWKELKSDEKLLPEIALAGAMSFEAAGEPDEAARILEAAIARQFLPSLVAAYARCDTSQVPRRLEKAESWLQTRPNDPDILTALGVLCLTGQLWGPAERYLRRSVQLRSDAQAHALLGSLYDRLERPNDAMRHWRLATAVGMALPSLAFDTALPAADMRADPHRLDAEGAFDDETGDSPARSATFEAAELPRVAPVPATASDYVLDPDARSIDSPTPPPDAVIAPSSSVDIEEYFDSAPIPLADMDEAALEDGKRRSDDRTDRRGSNH